MNTNANLKIVSLSTKVQGEISAIMGMFVQSSNMTFFNKTNLNKFFLKNTMVENIDIPMTVNASIGQRDDGKDYITLSDTSVNFNITYLKMKFSYKNVPSCINDKVSSVVNSNWFIMKPLLDSTINTFVKEILESIFTPMLNATPLQDVLNVNATV